MRAHLPAGGLQRRARVGDDDEVPAGLGLGQPGVEERLPVGPAVAVGLHRAAGLAGHHHDGALQPVGERRPDLRRVGGVQHGERPAEGTGDHLGRERRAAHAGEHHVVEVGQLRRAARRAGGAAPGCAGRCRPSRAGSSPPPRRPGPTAWRPCAASAAGTPSSTSAARAEAGAAAVDRVGAVHRQPGRRLDVVLRVLSDAVASAGSLRLRAPRSLAHALPPARCAGLGVALGGIVGVARALRGRLQRLLARLRAARCQLASNFSTPSRSSISITSSKSTPTALEVGEHLAGRVVGAGDRVAARSRRGRRTRG